MDAATTKQKAYIKDLFVKCGTPKWIFNPLKLWNISKSDAELLINSLRMMKKIDNEYLKDLIWESIQEKNAIQIKTKTVEELEEEAVQASYDPTIEDWLDQQVYSNNLSQRDWIQELKKDTLMKQEVIL